MVVRNANRRSDTQFDLAVPGDRGLPPARSRSDGGRRVARRSASSGGGPDQAAGRAALGGRTAVVVWKPGLDGRVGYSLVPLRNAQVPLQLRLLDQDDVARPVSPLYLHDSPPRDSCRFDLRSPAAQPRYRDHIAGSMVWRCVGRTLDRVFLKQRARTPKGRIGHYL